MLPFVKFAPEKQYSDASMKCRLYNEMNTCDWWWEKQVFLISPTTETRATLTAIVSQLQLPAGATLVPIIISTNKTQLCILSRGKSAYPVYMTIGNIDKDIQRKPSYHSQALIGYLPTTALSDTNLTETDAHLAHMGLFHHAMGIIVAPLKALAKECLELTSSDLAVCRGHPILAVYPSDYLEQALVTCTRYGVNCPRCDISAKELGNGKLGCPRDQVELLQTIHAAAGKPSKAQLNASLSRCGKAPCRVAMEYDG